MVNGPEATRYDLNTSLIYLFLLTLNICFICFSDGLFPETAKPARKKEEMEKRKKEVWCLSYDILSNQCFLNNFKHYQEAQPEEPARRSTKKYVKIQEDVEKEGGDTQSEDTESDQETYTTKKVNIHRVFIILF